MTRNGSSTRGLVRSVLTVVCGGVVFWLGVTIGLAFRVSPRRREENGPFLRGSNKNHKQASTTTTTRVHAFYYPWYESPKHDGRWKHWNHEHMPHWLESVNARHPPFRHDPDNLDIGSTFYPELGAYSSRDPETIAAHMSQMARARIGTVVVSWYPPAHHATENVDSLIPKLLDAAQQHGLQLCLHLEPYQGRTASTVRSDVDYAVAQYGKHPAYHRMRNKPVFYAYDSYQISTSDWDEAFGDDAKEAFFLIGLVLDKSHVDQYLTSSAFDGLYTYFGATGFTQAATPSAWTSYVRLATNAGKTFIPCVAPGYDDLRVRPWNGENKRQRRGGAYYDDMWRAALTADASVVAVTSFNEWHEGTQIETAIPFSPPGVEKYEDYGPHPPTFYLDRTREWIEKLLSR